MSIKKSLPRLRLIAFARGLLSRIHQLVMDHARIVRFFLARADGETPRRGQHRMADRGLSVSVGGIATNGGQPLAAFSFAQAYARMGGDEIRGLAAWVDRGKLRFTQAFAALADAPGYDLPVLRRRRDPALI